MYKVKANDVRGVAVTFNCGTPDQACTPTREVLFTVVPREDRYKAKNFIDTVVYRLGDQVGAWSYSLVGFFGASASALPIVALPISVLWLVNAFWLGRRQDAMAASLRARGASPLDPALAAAIA